MKWIEMVAILPGKCKKPVLIVGTHRFQFVFKSANRKQAGFPEWSLS